MKFTPIDRTTWERNSHYEYYTNLLKCGYSVTVSLDITKLHRQVKEKGLRFYPAFVYCVSRQIASTKEFRMGRDKDGNPGYYDVLHPNYTIFHEDDHTFSDVWTAYTEDFSAFYKNMCSDMETYRHVKAVKAKPGQPANFYCISCVPWLDYTGFASSTASDHVPLFPIITFGKYTETDGKLTLPMTLTIAHAAMDGWHTSEFFREMQEELEGFGI